MMRSLYSGVSGLKVHQTKMDVIGNNISNVNTIGFKASSVNFSDIFYQTTQSASGANLATGKAGTNARQIGLGSTVAGITANMTTQGGSQRTDNALDIMINGNAFFIVNSGGTNYFTKNGAFTTDGAGNLATESGATVMGWKVDPENPGMVVKGNVTPIGIYTTENTYTEPEATTNTYFSGNIDQNDEDLVNGRTIQTEFYDNLGNKYTAKYNLQSIDTVDKNTYNVRLTDILDSNGQSIFVESEVVDGITVYSPKSPMPTATFGGRRYSVSVDTVTGEATLSDYTYTNANGQTVTQPASLTLRFNGSTGKFVGIGYGANSEEAAVLSIDTGATGNASSANLFEDISVDFSSLTMYESSGNTSITSNRGENGTGKGAGTTKGKINGVSVSDTGKIYASYDNGSSKLLGQIAVATFTNPAGLEAVGNSMFQATQNSGEFDGIGSDISENGDSFTTGVLEMSNVDLSSEFTSMITTQRGFQANSRIITTSDTLLEELINLKR